MKSNLFAGIPQKTENEVTEILSSGKKFRVERIISFGQSSLENFWYDQSESEWVTVLQGEAVLEFQNDEILKMKAGDFVFIPAHQKHRVKSTSKDKATIWLAFFVEE